MPSRTPGPRGPPMTPWRLLGTPSRGRALSPQLAFSPTTSQRGVTPYGRQFRRGTGPRPSGSCERANAVQTTPQASGSIRQCWRMQSETPVPPGPAQVEDVQSDVETLRLMLSEFQSGSQRCHETLSRLLHPEEKENLLIAFHQATMKHTDTVAEMTKKALVAEDECNRLHNVVEQERELSCLKREELAFIQRQCNTSHASITEKRRENKLRMWETTTRVSFVYQLKQSLEILHQYRDRLLEERVRLRIEERNHAYDLLQNAIGNIRVFCRLRPSNGDRINASIERNNLVMNSESKMNVTGSGYCSNKYEFEFFHIFGERDIQKLVFAELRHFILSCLHGCNVTLFAYGQTGSGKTYTMEGFDNDPRHAGIRPRALREIITSIREWRRANILFDCEFSFLEIYNEQIKDLLADGRSRDVKENSSGLFYVADLTYQEITADDDIDRVLQDVQQLSKRRATGSTKANQNSSRSHSVFQFRITKEGSPAHYLSLVDLAGSERLTKTAATGKRAQESRSINLSLTALNDTLSALGNGNASSHIPFRQSKLTQLLKEPLCGAKSKVAMFVNISSSKDDFAESINSLRFATKVQGVKLNAKKRSTNR